MRAAIDWGHISGGPSPGFPPAHLLAARAFVGCFSSVACWVPGASLGRPELMPHMKEAGAEPGQGRRSSGSLTLFRRIEFSTFIHRMR